MEKSYKLPDGKVITIGSERFLSGEILFNPSLINKESQGIHKLTYDSIMKCDGDKRSDFFRSIILSGGTTLLPGFKQRLKRDIELIAPSHNENVIITASPERDINTFLGSSILGSLECIDEKWITRRDYDNRLCYVPLRGNHSSVRYNYGNGGNNGTDDIILKCNVSSTRSIH